MLIAFVFVVLMIFTAMLGEGNASSFLNNILFI